MKDKVQPLHDRVIIKPIPVEYKTPSGIIIPDSAKERSQKGIVMFCGNGINDEPMVVKIGDSVLYGKHAGQPINIDGDELLIMREADILAII